MNILEGVAGWAYRENGAPGRTRTCGHPLRRRMLYPAELRAPKRPNVARKDGRSGGIRTPDPLVPNQMRYQAALHSDLSLVAVAAEEVRILPMPPCSVNGFFKKNFQRLQ